jgi:hypothetical protein
VGVTEQALLVFFPQEFGGRQIKADVKLYSPANADMDRAFTGLTANAGRLEIPRSKLRHARYVMQLSWECAGNDYYQEFPLNLLNP